MWLLFACLAGAFYTVQGLLTRHILKGQKDAWAFSFYFSLIGALISLPFLATGIKIPFTWQPWVLVLLVGILIVGQNFLNFRSSNYIAASVGGAITKFRLVWVFILGVILLHEGFSFFKILGTLLTIAAGLVIIHKFKKPTSLAGVAYAFGATFLYAIVIILYKYLFTSFNSVSLTFFVTFLPPVILNLIFMPQALKRVVNIFRTDGLKLFLACASGAVANLALNQGLAIGEASKVLVLIEAFLVLTLVGEHILLKEKEYLWVKIIAVLLAVLGAIFIRIS